MPRPWFAGMILDKGGMVKRGRKLMGHETCPIILRKGTIV